MGKIDVAIYDYISDKTRIADLFNGVYFDGRQTIRAEDITDYEEKYPTKKKASCGTLRRIGKMRYRDIVKKWKNGGNLRVLAIENQNSVDYTMPFRCMEYEEEGKGVNMCKALEGLIQKGKEQATCDIIVKMHKAGITLEKICEIAEKTPEEVNEILNHPVE